MKVTVLCGGYGAARFVAGLVGLGEQLTCVVNVGDDFDHLGVRVCPDLDAVMYALHGVFDEARGWGQLDDSFVVNFALTRYGHEWFQLGDRDLALSLARTELLRSHASLSAATASLASTWGITARILPGSDEPAPTLILTEEGELSFQDFVVRRRARPRVLDVIYSGGAELPATADVFAQIESADVVVIAPSNPISSIGPILALGGVRDALARRTGPTVAVTPVVTASAPVTPAATRRAHLRETLMSAQGRLHVADAVAAGYRELIDGFVLDQRDAERAAAVEELGVAVMLADTLVVEPRARTRLAMAVVSWAASVGAGS